MSIVEPTVAHQLWNRPVLVYLQNQYIYKTGTDGHFGRIPGIHTGDVKKDLEFMEDVTVVSRVPVGLVLLYNKGIPFQFYSMQQMVWVYETLKTHIDNWIIEIKKPFGKPPPIDDLIKMDEFCEFLSLTTLEAIRQRDIILAGQNKSVDSIDRFWQKYSGGFGRRTVFKQDSEVDSEPNYYNSGLSEVINEHMRWSELNGNP